MLHIFKIQYVIIYRYILRILCVHLEAQLARTLCKTLS
jgi:hypothetical protein